MHVKFNQCDFYPHNSIFTWSWKLSSNKFRLQDVGMRVLVRENLSVRHRSRCEIFDTSCSSASAEGKPAAPVVHLRAVVVQTSWDYSWWICLLPPSGRGVNGSLPKWCRAFRFFHDPKNRQWWELLGYVTQWLTAVRSRCVKPSAELGQMAR